MSKRLPLRLTLTLILAAIWLLGISPVRAAEQIKPALLKVPLAFPSALPAVKSSIIWMADQAALISNGSLKINTYEPGQLVAPFEILDAVSTGKVNAGFSIAGYWAGKIPAANIFSSVPFGPESGEFLAWLYYGNGLKLYQQMYDQAGYSVKVIPCALLAPESGGWFKQPINGPEDIKGLNLRFFGLGGKVFSKLGASVSLIPGSELFVALERGAIDATEFSQPSIDQMLGFHKIAKYNYFPGWHQQASVIELLINKQRWNSLHTSQQATLDMLCKAAITNTLAQGEAIQYQAMQKNTQERGVTNLYWSPEMLALFESTWSEVVEEESKDPFFNKVWLDLTAFRNNYRVWQRHAFLPRSTAQQP
ncbi:C4-dicarboxylate ABC transporter [Motiliproteus coralliicola]|uniref:C4-dicarboxylate ABC transporter n=1 Tax=Motiliproteus coralliicola TaxID=2283196 RepID=A0A369WSH1_9GAMM|nr:TRAP transporter substrate-binding protein [Motiliproteus coralliicola]RDE24632.1 C4-dicarboxylate ABC transporter [Motiliproteus coralliicola]